MSDPSRAMMLGEEFYGSHSGLEDALENQDDVGDRPPYAWACRELPVCVLDYDELVSQATEDAYEGFDVGDLNGCGLREKLAEFNRANAGIVNWEPDYTRAVLLTHILPESRPEAETLSLSGPARPALDRFIAAVQRRDTNRCRLYHESIGTWREVLLHPRKDLCIMVQPVAKNRNVTALYKT